MYYREIASHSHGNRAAVTVDVDNQSLIRNFDSNEQRQLLKLSKTLSRGNADDAVCADLADLISQWCGRLI